MASFIAQIDQSFFMQMAMFVVFFAILNQIFFKPFSKLFEARHQKMVADREKAERLTKEAKEKLLEYESKLAQARQAAREEYEALLADGRKQESEILGHARNEIKKLTQESLQNVQKQRNDLKKSLEGELTQISEQIADKLLVKNR